MLRRPSAIGFCTVLALAAVSAASPLATADHGGRGAGSGFGRIKHIVVIYEENHSFDNLYGLWGSVNGEPVNGIPQASADRTVQRAQNGSPYVCLRQSDVNLTSPPLPATCADPDPAVGSSAFTNRPFVIDEYLPSTARTCPVPGQLAPNGVPDPTGLPGGCTRDLVHRFYQEQYQQQFLAEATHGMLPSVSFVKPAGEENEHPGYASEPGGSEHLVDLIRAIQSGPEADKTMIVVTYDEFGGQWDHVPVPGTAANPGPHDAIGPGTRIPTLVISNAIRRSGVDHTQYDAMSILATIEQRFGLRSLTDPSGSPARDARVNDLAGVLAHHHKG